MITETLEGSASFLLELQMIPFCPGFSFKLRIVTCFG